MKFAFFNNSYLVLQHLNIHRLYLAVSQDSKVAAKLTVFFLSLFLFPDAHWLL